MDAKKKHQFSIVQLREMTVRNGRKNPKRIHDSCKILLQRQIKKSKRSQVINSLYYQQNIFEEFPALCGKDIDNLN